MTPLAHAELDVCKPEQARSVLAELRPDVVINTSAFHKVDVCEDEPEASFAVNATGAYNLARLAAEMGFTLVHFSSDYVFDGRVRSTRKETDLAEPISVYGTSKLAGECLVRGFCPRHFVIRTTGLYGVAGASGKGGNFVETMIRLGKTGNPVQGRERSGDDADGHRRPRRRRRRACSSARRRTASRTASTTSPAPASAPGTSSPAPSSS